MTTTEWHIPGWRVLGRIARGSTADVLLAEPDLRGEVTPAALSLGLASHQRVVLKRLYPHLAEREDFVGMFVDEVKLLSRLRSPFLVDVYDLDEDDESFYAVLELVDGPSASAALRLRSRAGVVGVDVDVAAAICARVARALAAVHAAVDDSGGSLGLVHRDLNPQNILLGRDGVVKIGDFGVALSAHGRRAGLLRNQDTGAGVLKGKVNFMAPEQVRGAAVDVRADLFALGATAHTLLTGQPPFARSSDLETFDAILHAAPPPLASSSAPFDALVARLLAKDPSDRPASAVDVAAAFAAICDDDDAIARCVVRLGLPSLRA